MHLQKSHIKNGRFTNKFHDVKKITYQDFMTILKNIDQELLKGAISGEKFQEYFFANCQVPEIADYIKSVLGK